MLKAIGRDHAFSPVLHMEKGETEVEKACQDVRKLFTVGRVNQAQLSWWEEFRTTHASSAHEKATLPIHNLKVYRPKSEIAKTVEPNLEKALLTKITKNAKDAKVDTISKS